MSAQTTTSLTPKSPPLETISLGSLPERPAISIVVPSFNQGQFIRATIDSILEQDYRPIRIHVVDGGSKDETVAVLESYGQISELDWISEPDRGVVDGVNKGFARVTGDIVGIQSSDDTYLPNAFSTCVERFLGDASLGLLYGDTIKVDAEGNELSRHVIGPYSLRNLYLCKSWIPQPSCFFRRELLEACGGWDERIPYAPDTDLWIRMAYRTNVLKIDEYLSQRRMHDAQRDTQAIKIVNHFAQMIDQSPDLAASSNDLQQAAQAGKHLMHVRYNPSGSDWASAWHRWKAGQICPEVRNTPGVLADLALPVRRVLSRVKRTVIGQSPTS